MHKLNTSSYYADRKKNFIDDEKKNQLQWCKQQTLKRTRKKTQEEEITVICSQLLVVESLRLLHDEFPISFPYLSSVLLNVF